MGLRVKNFNILGVHWKTKIEGALPKKGGLGQFADLRGEGGLGKKEGVLFLRGGLIPQCTLCNSDNFRELIQNNTTHFLSEFISNNTDTFREILSHKTLFVRVRTKQYRHFQRVTNKQFIFMSSHHIPHVYPHLNFQYDTKFFSKNLILDINLHQSSPIETPRTQITRLNICY